MNPENNVRIELKRTRQESNLGFLVLESKTLVAAFSATLGTQRIPRIALHANSHTEKACFSLRESCHGPPTYSLYLIGVEFNALGEEGKPSSS